MFFVEASRFRLVVTGGTPVTDAMVLQLSIDY
jgi:hypothetical protein